MARWRDGRLIRKMSSNTDIYQKSIGGPYCKGAANTFLTKKKVGIDKGSGTGSWIRIRCLFDPGSGSQTYIFESLMKNFSGKKSYNF
jgi:hypothetical protein